MSDFFVTLVLKTVIRKLADSLIFKTTKASNSNILVQTLNYGQTLSKGIKAK